MAGAYNVHGWPAYVAKTITPYASSFHCHVGRVCQYQTLSPSPVLWSWRRATCASVVQSPALSQNLRLGFIGEGRKSKKKEKKVAMMACRLRFQQRKRPLLSLLVPLLFSCKQDRSFAAFVTFFLLLLQLLRKWEKKLSPPQPHPPIAFLHFWIYLCPKIIQLLEMFLPPQRSITDSVV
jgi:hypothetical protein